MALTSSGVCFVLVAILSNAKGIPIECKPKIIQSPIDGQACETLQYTNISVSERHHCTLTCTGSKDCSATIFDRRHSICMLLSQSCNFLMPRTDHVYQSFEPPCTKWVNASDVPQGYMIHEEPVRQLPAYVARANADDDIVVGKMSDQFYAVHPNGPSEVRRSQGFGYEELVVHAACSVTWVPYTAASGEPLPRGAFVGGFLVHTSTPLYVSRITFQDKYKVIGYYNPLDQLSWASFAGVRSNATSEIMVIERFIWYNLPRKPDNRLTSLANIVFYRVKKLFI